jgi:ATP/maltotriose-dependent transcriptional regulator MalT
MVELGDRQNEGQLLGNLGAYLNEMDDLPAATDALERSLEIVRALDDTRSVAFSLINLGEVRLRSGEAGIALPMLTEAIDILVQAGNVQAIALARIVLARILLAQGATSEALANLRSSLVALRQMGDMGTAAEAIDLVATVAIAIDAIAEADCLLTWAESIRSNVGVEVRPSLAADVLANRLRVNGLLGPDAPRTGSPTLAPVEIVGAAIRTIESLRRRLEKLAPGAAAATVAAIPAPDEDAPSVQAATRYGLSSRELDVLRLLCQGRSTREIGDQLCISPRTVATHVANIIGKLDVRSRTAAVALAMRLRLV